MGGQTEDRAEIGKYSLKSARALSVGRSGDQLLRGIHSLLCLRLSAYKWIPAPLNGWSNHRRPCLRPSHEVGAARGRVEIHHTKCYSFAALDLTVPEALMRVFKTKIFGRFARKADIDDAVLRAAIKNEPIDN